jgi:murein DD-endopeptidase MepM/ murein hydrolase activator NlpD
MTIRYYPILATAKNICSGYGPRGTGFHYGVDLCAPMGTPLIAVDDGALTFGTDPKGGNVAHVKTSDGVMYYYAHLSAFEGKDRTVRAGDTIGYVGMTGNAITTLPHLHFEMWPSGALQRPAPDPTAQINAAPILYQQPSEPSGIGTALAIGAAIVVGSGLIALLVRRARLQPAYLRARPSIA